MYICMQHLCSKVQAVVVSIGIDRTGEGSEQTKPSV